MEYDELELDTLGDQKTALFVIPVSYTHLDVYKRQRKDRTKCFFVFCENLLPRFGKQI